MDAHGGCVPCQGHLLGVVVVIEQHIGGCVGSLGADIGGEFGLGAGTDLIGHGDDELDITCRHGDSSRGVRASLDSARSDLVAVGGDGVTERARQGIALVGGGGSRERHSARGGCALKVYSEVIHSGGCLIGCLRLDDTQVDQPRVVRGLHQLRCSHRTNVGVDLIEVALLIIEHDAPVEATGVCVVGHRAGVGRDVVDAQVAQRHDLDLGATAHIGGADGIEPAVLTDAVEHALVIAGNGCHGDGGITQNGARGGVGREVDGGEFAVDHLPTHVEVIENAIVGAGDRVVGHATAADVVAIHVAQRDGEGAFPGLHVILNMVEHIGVGLVEVVPNCLEVDALHLAVLIDGTAQRSLIDIAALGELGQGLSG